MDGKLGVVGVIGGAPFLEFLQLFLSVLVVGPALVGSPSLRQILECPCQLCGGGPVLGKGLPVPELILLRVSMMPQAQGLTTLLVISNRQHLKVLQIGGTVLGQILRVLRHFPGDGWGGAREPSTVVIRYGSMSMSGGPW